MRIFDCLIINDELDLLEARFRELEDVPGVTHVIAEAPVDFQGNPKPRHFTQNAAGRFARWHGRWNSVQAEPHELPGGAPLERKDSLRDCLAHAFNGEPGDLVMISNPDEIPSADAVRRLLAGEIPLPVTLGMRWHAGDEIQPEPWHGTVVQARQHIGSFSGLRRRRKEFPVLPEAGVRLAR
jgi:hypothetical protein